MTNPTSYSFPQSFPASISLNVSQIDLLTPTSTQKYPLGFEHKMNDMVNGTELVYVYTQAKVALTQYQPYMMKEGSTGPVVRAPVQVTVTSNIKVVIPQVDFTINYYGFVLQSGVGKAKMTASGIADGDSLQLVNTASTLSLYGSTGSPVVSTNTCAFAKGIASSGVATINLASRKSGIG